MKLSLKFQLNNKKLKFLQKIKQNSHFFHFTKLEKCKKACSILQNEYNIGSELCELIYSKVFQVLLLQQDFTYNEHGLNASVYFKGIVVVLYSFFKA